MVTIKMTRWVFISLLMSQISLAGTPAKDALDLALFNPNNPELNTDGAMVLVNGKNIYEKYARGYDTNSKHISWSTAKAISGILMGIAADQGYFKLTDPVKKFIPEFKGTATILDVLQMSSNIEFFEEYEGVPIKSDVVRMLYLFGPKKGMANYTLSLPLRSNTHAGDYYYYSSGDTNVLMEILRRAVGEEKYKTFPWTEFFNKIGMNDVTFERDSHGTYVGSSYIYATLRQYATWVSLLVNNGFHNGVRVIPASYMQLMNTVAPGALNNHLPGEDSTAYSSQIHTNQPIPGHPGYSELPPDALYVYGYQGQMFYAIPSLHTVIVRTGTEYGDGLSTPHLLNPVWDFIKEQGYPSHPTPHVMSSRLEDKSKFGDLIQTIKDDLEYRRVPKLINTLAAKEMCSCVFVVKRRVADCLKDIKTVLPVIPSYKFDWKKKNVGVNLFVGKRHRAEFVSEQYGCRLLN